jgi:hypothetical protein
VKAIIGTLFFLVAGALLCAQALAGFPTSRPFPGVTFAEEIRHDPPQRLYRLYIDLTNPAIHLRVCPGSTSPPGDWETALLPVSKIAQREHLDIAINGSLFSPKYVREIFGTRLPYFVDNPARELGWTVSDGRLWSHHPMAEDLSTLLVSRSGDVSIQRLTDPPAAAAQAVSGIPIVSDGRNIGPDDAPAPHTAVGLDRSRKQLTVFINDGRRPDYAVGLSLKQLGQVMLDLGCDSALNLDGGGSTTLVFRHGEKWQVINTPSDGHTLPIPLCIERPVGCALGVTVERESGK